MHPQLEEVSEELRAASGRLGSLAESLPDDLWRTRPTPDRWSASECVAHLNITSEMFLPLLREGVGEARARGEPAPARYRRDPLGWLLWRTMGPPVRMRTKTPAAFVPTADEAPGQVRAEFERLQAELQDIVRDADGLPLQAVKITSPFDARARYNLYSALTVVARHQHRHLWQAEQAGAALQNRAG